MKQFVILFSFALTSFGINAQTNIAGTLTKDTKLDLAGSPYLVTSNLGVPNGITLTIDTGVTVNFNGTAQLIIQGALIAVGTSKNPINFNNKGGIMFQKANLNLNSLSNLKITNSAIKLFNNPGDSNSGILLINNLTILNSEITTNYSLSNAAVVINNSKITNSKLLGGDNSGETIRINNSIVQGSQIVASSQHGIFLENDTCYNTSIQISGQNGPKINISGTALYNCMIDEPYSSGPPEFKLSRSSLFNTGIKFNYYAIVNIQNCVLRYDSNYSSSYCLVSNNASIVYTEFIARGSLNAIERGGLSGGENSFKISNCTFKGFATNLKINKWTQSPVGHDVVKINGCSFSDKPTNYFIQNLSPYDIDASGNYWGSASDSIISKYVYDFWDDISYGKVIFTNKSQTNSLQKNWIDINSLTTNPGYLLTKNNTKLVTNVKMRGIGKLVTHHYTISNDTINLEACYYPEFGLEVSNVSDTIEIGKLVTGNYVVYFRASLSPDPFNCDSVSATSKLFQIKVNEPTFEIHSINATNRLINSEVKVNTKMLITGASKTTFKNQFLRNDTLFIEECYYAEDDTEPKFYDDTFYFKNLKAGLYIVQFKANRTSDKNSCFIQNTLVKYSQFIVRKYKIIINSIITTPIIPKPDQFFKITTNVTTAFSGQLIKLGQYINKDTIFLNYCIYDDGKQIEKTFNLDYTISLPIENNYVAMIKITASNNYTKCIDSYSADSLIYFSIQYNDIHKYNKYPKPIVYPNPFKNNINFSGDPVRSFVILNSLGQSIYSEVNIGSKKEINLEILPRGVYTIELILNNGRIYREKLLKE